MRDEFASIGACGKRDPAITSDLDSSLSKGDSGGFGL